MTSDALEVTSDVVIPRSELTFRATRAGGPGGQHVNKTSSRIELTWNVESSRSISGEQRARLREKLASRLDATGSLRVVASESRSQARNRDDAEQRLIQLLRRALAVPKARRKTRPSRSAVESRLSSKRRRSDKKQERRARDYD